MKRKLSLLFSLTLLLGLTLFGCQSKDDGAAEGQVTIDFWSNLADSGPLFDRLIEEFEGDNPDIKVKLNNVNAESSDAEYQAAISDNNLPDMFVTDAFSMNELVDLDLVRDISSVFPEEARSKYTEGVFDQGKTMIGDNVYLFPISRAGTYMMYYNKEVLDGLGIKDLPETWDDMLRIGKEVYDKSDGKSHGLIFGGSSGWLVNAVSQLMATELSPEAGYNYTEGNYKYATEGHKETIKFFKEMLDNDALSPLSLENSSTIAMEMFAVGQAAFLIDGNWTGQLLTNSNEFEDWGVIPLPTKNADGKLFGEFSVGSNDGMFVAENTEHWDEVKLFLEFLRDNMYDELVKDGAATVAVEFDLIDVEAPFPQLEDIQNIFMANNYKAPNPVANNPKALEVQLEHRKHVPDLNIGQILMGYLTGQVKDLDQTLEEYSKGYNDAFDKALDSNDDVTREDFTFPNWVPYEPYTDEMLEELKK